MVDTSIRLIKDGERYQDENGIWRTSEVQEREILARMSSVDRREFFSGGQAGMRPEYQFVIFFAEYQGEEICEYNGERYAIYRTFHVPGTDALELYVQREVGVAHGG